MNDIAGCGKATGRLGNLLNPAEKNLRGAGGADRSSEHSGSDNDGDGGEHTVHAAALNERVDKVVAGVYRAATGHDRAELRKALTLKDHAEDNSGSNAGGKGGKRRLFSEHQSKDHDGRNEQQHVEVECLSKTAEQRIVLLSANHAVKTEAKDNIEDDAYKVGRRCRPEHMTDMFHQGNFTGGGSHDGRVGQRGHLIAEE